MNSCALNQAFKYPQCQKGNYHTGEVLSLVCIQPACLENSVICGICYNESHKKHKIKPLKIVINNSRKYLQNLTPMKMDPKEIKTLISQQKKNIFNKYDELEKYLKESIEMIKENLNAVFIKINEKIDFKTGSNEQFIAALDEIKEQQLENSKFISLIQKLLAGVPLEEEEDTEVSSKQVQESIVGITSKIQKNFSTKAEILKQQINNLSEMLKKIANNPGIFDLPTQFKFSSELKHNGVQTLSDTIIKSVQSYNYHFALMEPKINDKKNQAIKVAFLIKQNTSNWIAVGLCHKKPVIANNFQFNYSTLGHGGYLISSNGGSWSSIDNTKNNVVTSFHFSKDDIIIVSYNPEEKKIVFSKKTSNQSHTLEVENNKDDDLHLCCLFYYNNDEIEFLGNYNEV